MTVPRKSLFVLPHNPHCFGDDDIYLHFSPKVEKSAILSQADKNLLFSEVLKIEDNQAKPNPLYEKIMVTLNHRMTKAFRGDREDKIDAIGFWQNLIQFYNFKSRLTDEELKQSGYKSAEDYELSRRNRAKHLMVALNMIDTTAEFISDQTGSDFFKEDIASLDLIDVHKMHELSGFDKVILIDIMCGTQKISL